MLPLGRRTADTDDKVEVLRAYVEQLPKIPFLSGQSVSGTILTGKAVLLIRHTLKRPYEGAFIVGVSVPQAVQVLTPDSATAGGDDITQFVVLVTGSAVSQDTDVNLWVF